MLEFLHQHRYPLFLKKIHIHVFWSICASQIGVSTYVLTNIDQSLGWIIAKALYFRCHHQRLLFKSQYLLNFNNQMSA